MENKTFTESHDTELFLNAFNQIEAKQPSKVDLEFEKYCKLYEEKFGKRSYIAEPGEQRSRQ